MNPTCKARLTLQSGKVIECNRDEGHESSHALLIGGEGAVQHTIPRGKLLVDLENAVCVWPSTWGMVAGVRQEAQLQKSY